MKIGILLALTGSLLPPLAHADQALVELNEKFEPAVVKIEARQSGVTIGYGSGFFVSGDGKLVTNLHVVKAALGLGTTLHVITKDKKVIDDVSVVSCGDDRELDLCILKVPYESKAFFDVKPVQLKKGTDLIAIGHPKGYEYSLSQGILSGVHPMAGGGFVDLDTSAGDDAKAIETVQTTTPISPGNSGGPLFDNAGHLIGVSTWKRADKDSENLNFAISANEVAKYLDAHPEAPISFDAFRASFVKKKQTIAKKFHTEFGIPQSNALLEGKPLDPKVFHYVPVSYLGKTYKFGVLNSMKTCLQIRGAGMGLLCPGKGYSFVLTLTKAAPGGMAAIEGTRPASKPLPAFHLLEELKKKQKNSAAFTPEQMKQLFSDSSAFKCKKMPSNKLNPAISEADRCWSTTLHDTLPNALSSQSIFLLADGTKITSTVWSEDFAYEEIASDVSSLSGGSVRVEAGSASAAKAGSRPTVDISKAAAPKAAVKASLIERMPLSLCKGNGARMETCFYLQEADCVAKMKPIFEACLTEVDSLIPEQVKTSDAPLFTPPLAKCALKHFATANSSSISPHKECQGFLHIPD